MSEEEEEILYKLNRTDVDINLSLWVRFCKEDEPTKRLAKRLSKAMLEEGISYEEAVAGEMEMYSDNLELGDMFVKSVVVDKIDVEEKKSTEPIVWPATN